jgi:hypothetical protein
VNIGKTCVLNLLFHFDYADQSIIIGRIETKLPSFSHLTSALAKKITVAPMLTQRTLRHLWRFHSSAQCGNFPLNAGASSSGQELPLDAETAATPSESGAPDHLSMP